MKRTPLLAAMLVLLPLAASAEIYRWVDAQGGVHYSQMPPKGQAVETVRPAPPPASAGDNGLGQYAGELEKARTEQARQQGEAEAKRKERERRCVLARQRLQMLDERGPHRLATKQPDGEYERWTTEKFDQERGKAQQVSDKDCEG